MKLTLLHESEGHTCRFPPSGPDDESQLRRNRKQCNTCAAMYDAASEEALDAGFTGTTFAPRPGDVEAKAPTMARRRKPQPGAFGTGRPAPFDPNDPVILQQLKTLRDMGGEEWSRKGEDRFGKRVRSKPVCSYKHSCTDPSAPMPDPYASLATGANRHNEYFTDAGPSETDDRIPAVVNGEKTYQRPYMIQWPISGLMGKKPKPEYAEFVYEKLACAVCSGQIEGCDNRVSTEFGKPKKYCKDHVELSDYPKELLGRFGGPGLPDQPDPNVSYRETEAKWKEQRAKFIERGDEVKKGKLRGAVLEVDPEMEDRTHRVKWSNPKAEALSITWEDPKNLDLVY